MIVIQQYSSELEDVWDSFVNRSTNYSFLHLRKYMDYHSDRFKDFSLIIKKNDKIVAVLPANHQESVLYSHQGLTYGGLIIGNKWNTKTALDVFRELFDYLRTNNFKQIIYKPMPYIYGAKPFQEDLYAIHVNNGKIMHREISSTITMLLSNKYSKGRKWGVKKGKKHNLEITETDDITTFYEMLYVQMQIRYNKEPVHSLSELKLLKSRFPNNIRLFNVIKDDQVIAGTIIYENSTVAHVQYITSNEKGKELFALDFLFDYLLQNIYVKKLYFDFGISTENNGQYLNKGLVQFKEYFGASGVCYDTYVVDLL